MLSAQSEPILKGVGRFAFDLLLTVIRIFLPFLGSCVRARVTYLIIVLFAISLNISAQQSVVLSWPLTSPYEVALPSPVATLSFAAGRSVDSLSFSAEYGAMSSGWNTDNLDPEAYYEYQITPAPGTSILINQLNFEVSLSRVNMRTSVQYSYDGFTSQKTQIGHTVYIGTPVPRNLPVKTSLRVAYPQTLSIRFYGWSTVDHNVTFHNRSVSFEGVAFGKDLIADANTDNLEITPEEPVVVPLAAMAVVQPGDTMVGSGNLVKAPMGSQTYIASGTWICPPGVFIVTAECWGGGGKGGSVSGNSAQGGGGAGGGGYSKRVDIPVVPGTTYIVTVGAGSTDGNIPGGDSWFINAGTVLARGGGSVPENTLAHAAGGAVGIGTPPFIYIGGNGADGDPGNYGGGGGSSAGTGSNGVNTYNQTGATAPTGGGNGGNGRISAAGTGFPGINPGGGGGGAMKTTGNQTYAGGNGGAGKVVLTFCTVPTAFNVTGGGAYCSGGSGSPIGLSGSEAGMSYQLYRNVTTSVGSPIPGTGNAISFGNQTVVGTYTVVATNPDGMCTAVMNGSVTVSINPQPTATISGTTTVCQNTPSPNIMFTGANGTAPYTFTYRINGGANLVTPAGNPVNVPAPTGTAGSFTYTLMSVQDALGCSQNQSGSATVTVLPGTPAQPGPIAGNPTPCPGLTNQQYSITNVPAATSYTWTVPTGWTVTAGAGTNIINVTVGALGQDGDITVTATNSCGTSSPSTLAVTVLPGTPAVPGPITGTLTQCPNVTGQIYSIDAVTNATSYNWTVPTGWSITGGAGTTSITVTTGNTGQNGTITVRAVNTCGISGTRNLAVNIGPGIPATPGAISGTANVCPNTANLFYSITPVANATSYTWVVPAGWTLVSGQGTNSITVTSGATGTNGNITVTASNICGVSSASTLPVTVLPGTPATPGPIAGTVTQCGNLTGQIYSIAAVANASNYTWTVPPGWAITAGQGTTSITVTTGTPGQNGNITVTAANSCGTSLASTLAVTVSPGTPAVPGPITGPIDHCFQQTGQVYSIASVTNATTYTWTVPTGWSITNGQGTTSITVTTGTPGQNGNITVTAGNVCGTSTPRSLAVTVSTVPPQTSAITPAPTSVCEASSLTFSVTAVAGVYYAWTFPSDWAITAGQGTNQITVTVGAQSGNISVTPSNYCGNGTTTSHAVTVNLLPASAGPITGETDFCQGTSGHEYSVVFDPGVINYNWTVPSGWTFTGQGSNIIEADVSETGVSGQVVVTPQNGCGDGPSSTFDVIVFPLPAAFTGPDGDLCAGGEVRIGGPPVGANLYSWTSDPAGFTSTISNPLVQPFVTTTYYLTETDDDTGCANSNDITITTSQNLSLTIVPSTQTICPGAEFTINVTSNVLGTTYFWERDNTVVLTGTPENGTTVPITGILNSSNPNNAETTVFTIIGTGISSGEECADKQQVRVIVIDNTPLIINCPIDQFRNTNAGVCTYTAVGDEFDPIVIDNCEVTLTNNFNGAATLAGAVFPIGTTVVRWTGVDPGGFNATCTFNITVSDNIPPVISCVGNQTVTITSGCIYEHTGTAWDAIATDNCSVTDIRYELFGATNGTGSSLDGVNFNTGNTRVVWTASDGINEVSCTFDVTVIDNVPPSITCPGPIAANTSSTTCTAALNLPHPTIGENCLINSLTWEITGATSGNSSGTGVNYVPNGYIFNLGTSTVTYIITDEAGLTATCSFDVVVTDNVLPTFTCPTPNSFYPNTPNQCYAALSFAATNVFDNCQVLNIIYSVGGVPITFPYNFPVGTTAVTIVVTDINGNSSLPCTFNVNVRDTELPTIACRPSPQTRTANSGICNYTAIGNEFDPLSFSDNCPGAYISNNYNSSSTLNGASFPIGNTTVVWTVSDISSPTINTSTCSLIVTVTDNENPQLINCPGDITVYTGPGHLFCSQTATWTPPTVIDNCTGSVNLISNYSPGATFPVGITTVIYTATDPSGNTATCSFTVTVIDNTPPTFVVPADITIPLDALCNYNAGIAFTGNVSNLRDNCPLFGIQATYTDATVSGACPGTFIITRTWSLTDFHGNTTTQAQIITVADILIPTLSDPPDITVQCHLGTDPSVTGQPTVSDNCGNPVTVTYSDVIVAGSCPDASDITRTWTATDCSGNTTARTQLIYVRDNTPPVILNIVDYSVDCPNNIPPVDPTEITASDNCGAVTIVFTHEVAQFPPDVPGYCPRHITRFYRVSDECGNFVIAEQEIIIASVCECSECSDDAPYHAINFNGQPSGDTTIVSRRAGLCCHAEKPDDCISFNIYIDEGSVGLQISVGGAVPGSHDWKINCIDIEINNGIICLPGGAFYLFTYCKPGGNANSYRFTALADIVVAGEFESRVSCGTQVNVSTNVTNLAWNSIFPGTPGQYNGFLSCLDCPNPIFTPAPGSPPVIQYQVCGNVANSPCVGVGGYGCDTVTMYVHEPINVSFNVDPGQFCLQVIPEIIVTVTPAGASYILEWFAGSDTTVAPIWTGNNFVAPGPGAYTLKVTDTDAGVPCSIYLYPFVVAPDDVPPVITVPPPLTLECKNPGNSQAILDWLALAFATDENPITLTNDYVGITEACGTIVTVTWTATDDCENTETASSTITIIDTQVPVWTSSPGSINATLECSDASGLAAAQALIPIADDQCDETLSLIKIPGAFVAGDCPQEGTYTNTFIAEDDCFNRSIIFTQIITIQDNTAPIWQTTPGSLNASFDCSDAAGIAAAQSLLPIATDNCDLSIIAVKTAGLFVPNATCTSAGTYTNTFIATDDCGNSTGTFTQIITITDNNLPIIVTEAQNEIVECGPNNTNELNAWIANHGGAVASDACSNVLSWTNTPPVFTAGCGGTGVYTVTFIVNDNCGNSVSTEATFTIADTQGPEFTCPDDVLANVDLTTCTATGVDLGEPALTNDCSEPVTYTNNAPSAFPPGVTIVTWTATDACGNSATCQQTVTVEDLIPPTVDCPADVTANADIGHCAANVTVPAPVVTDPCPYTMTNDYTGTANASGNYPVGTTTVIWTITGISGNITTCTQLVTVIDTQAPTISCPDNQLFTALPPDCEYEVTTIPDPGLTDNCGTAALSLSWVALGATPDNGTGSVNGTIFPVGVTTVIYTVTDAAGNFATCQFTVTINDDVPPAFIECPDDITVSNDAGMCHADVIVPEPEVTDPCGEIVSVINDFNNTGNASGRYPIGTTEVKWTITDASNNTNTCTQYITVNDVELPIIDCPDDVLLEATPPDCTIPNVTLSQPAYSDNCDDPVLTWVATGATTGSGTGFVTITTFNVGITVITYTVTDASGNEASCSFNVVVNDDVPPTVVACAPDVTVNADPGSCETEVTVHLPDVYDPCGEIVSISHNSPVGTPEDPSGIYLVGIHTIIWTFTDESGNTSTCTQTITVVDNQFPTLTCPENVTAIATPPLCEVPDIVLGLPTFGDNCPNPVLTWAATGATTGSGTGFVSITTFNVGTTTITYRVTDASGNVTSCLFTVIVNDEVPPTVITCPEDISVVVPAGSCEIYISVPAPVVDDPCEEIVTIEHDSPHGISSSDASGTYPAGVYIITWTFTDESGNESNCEQEIEVIDDQAPEFTFCPGDVLAQATPPDCEVPNITLDQPIYRDNCADPILTWVATGVTPGSGTGFVNITTFNVGTTVITYTITDASGNTATCTFNVVVNDDVPPTVVTCPPSVTEYADAGLCSTYVTVPAPDVYDPCGEIVSVTHNSFYGISPEDASGIYPVGIHPIIWTFTDESGNTSTCPQTITVIDNQLPVITTCPGDVTAIATPPLCEVPAIVVDNIVFSDNCPNPVLTWIKTGATTGSGTGLVNNTTFNVGVTTVTYTVTDASGNTATCSFTVTVNDQLPPTVITCPADETVNAPADACEAYVASDQPVVTDPCGEIVTWSHNSTYGISSTDASGIYPVGVHTITWTFEDASGNETTCEQIITVVDITPPALTCPPPFSVPADFGEPFATNVIVPPPTYSDACGVEHLSYVVTGVTVFPPSPLTGINIFTSPNQFNVGVTTITYTATDVNGNIWVCDFDITVLSEPEIDCPLAISVNTDPGLCSATLNPGQPTLISGAEPITWTWTMTGATIASGTGMPITPDPFSFNVGVTTITWRATNTSGFDECVQTITVTDNEVPTFVPPTLATGYCVEDFIEAFYNPGGSYYVDDLFFTDMTTPARRDYYIFTPPSTELDLSSINDNCALASPNYISWTIDFGNNGSIDLTGNGQFSAYSASIQFPLGENLITWTVSDSSGNQTTATAILRVLPRPEILD